MRFLNLSREVVFHLTKERAERLRDRGLFDVMDMPGNPSQFQEAVADPERFARILWELTDQDGMTLQQFAEALSQIDGRQLIDVFLGELFGFFRDLATSVAESVIDEARSLITRLSQNEARQNTNSDSIEPGIALTNSPESAESIPPSSLYDSSTTWLGDDNRPNGNEPVL